VRRGVFYIHKQMLTVFPFIRSGRLLTCNHHEHMNQGLTTTNNNNNNNSPSHIQHIHHTFSTSSPHPATQTQPHTSSHTHPATQIQPHTSSHTHPARRTHTSSHQANPVHNVCCTCINILQGVRVMRHTRNEKFCNEFAGCLKGVSINSCFVGVDYDRRYRWIERLHPAGL